MSILEGVFSVLKSYDRYIEFVFVTGVLRFSYTSLFSGSVSEAMNQIEDES
ncbi:MAG: AAA family ATPase [Muribaculaceae bacterium]|nr:AAA family ATPase [Muribaculaceae bacterium]MDE6795386.1 AAA family ATPase [Muribaculaceae bacterium]